MTNFLQDLEQDPFSPVEFVERYAWRSTNGALDQDNFDPKVLYEAFDTAIKSLKTIYDTHKKKCERFETVCKDTEKKHWLKIAELQEKCKKAISIFQELDGHLDGVATKVVYLGDQLEGVNTPRARAEEAQRLMKQFSEFLKAPSVKSQLLIDPSKLYEEADVILKLYLISQELPSGGKFDVAKQRIFVKYDQIEKELIEEFVNAQRNDDKVRMKELAKILSHFKGYSQCIDAFIENAQSCYFGTRSIFNEIVPLCQKSQTVVNEVFTTPEQVMSKFVLNIYYGKLQEHVQHQLESDFKDSELYLKQLYELYSNTNKLSEQLSNCKIMGSDHAFLSKLTKNIFAKYLQNYIEVETKNLKEKYNAILERFYECKNHQKKPIPSGSIQELKRDLQVKIGRANINIGNLANLNITTSTTDTSALKETFLSEEIAISIIQETKDALQRCELLSKMSSNLPNHVIDILDLLLHNLFQEHLDYSIELGLMGLSNFEIKPEVKFFEIVGQCNGICHLFEKQFYSSFLPLVASTPKYGECLKRKRETMEQLESKLNNGIEKCITGIIGWIKTVLQNEQKKTDFRPESEDMVDMVNTLPCTKVVRFLSGYVQQIVPYLDGKNKESVLMELGVRFHKVVYEHLLQFQYSSIGAMLAILDVNSYRVCAEEFKIPLVNQLFSTLHALCNLLVVEPKNLKVVSNGESLSMLDKSVLINFVQLRADYKSAKLINQFK